MLSRRNPYCLRPTIMHCVKKMSLPPQKFCKVSVLFLVIVGSLCLIKYHSIKTYDEVQVQSHSLNFGTRWLWVASFMLRSLYTWYPLRKELGWTPASACGALDILARNRTDLSR